MDQKIYALFDFELNVKKNFTLEKFLQLPKVKKASLLQYRDKINTFSQQKANILFLKQHFHGSVIVNDNLELALFADGLHVGQEDVLQFDTNIEKAVFYLKERIGSKILGLSTHNQDEIEIANNLPLDYIGLGAYRPTITKNVTNILGKNISSLVQMSKHEVAVIGGVKSTDNIAHAAYLVLGSNLYEN